MVHCRAPQGAPRARFILWLLLCGAGSAVPASAADTAVDVGVTEPIREPQLLGSLPESDVVRDPVASGDGAVLAAALDRASEPANPYVTVVWDRSPESAHGTPVKRDAQGRALQFGEASWYGPNFVGRATASGEVYDMHAATVAHPSWPLGSVVRIENVENGRSVIARINDRGPYARDRILDCSYAIAQALGFVHRGYVDVRVTMLDSAKDAWTRFEGLQPPRVISHPAPRVPPPSQREVLLALAEDTAPAAPLVLIAATAAEPIAPERPVFRTASVLPFPAIVHGWQRLSRWVLGDESQRPARWARIERAGERLLGLRGLVRFFTHS